MNIQPTALVAACSTGFGRAAAPPWAVWHAARPYARGACLAMVVVAGAALLTTPACAAGGDAGRAKLSPWVELWAASPERQVEPMLQPKPVLKTAPVTLSDQTIRQVVWLSAGGSKLRLRLINEYTDAPTAVGAVEVAVSTANGVASSGIVAGTTRVVTFSGQGAVTLAPNAAALSDPIDLPVKPLTSLAVSIYVSQGTAPTTFHRVGRQTAYIASGNQTKAATFDVSSPTTQSRYLLSGIDGYEPGGGSTIVTLGDSITDGVHSTMDANRRWPDVLAKRLQQTSLQNLAVANEGIAGNRLLKDGHGSSALSRLDKDVLSRPGVRFVTVLEGINDIGLGAHGLGPRPAPADIIGAYQQIIARAHDQGALVFGCTLTPYQRAGFYDAAGEQTRESVNDFIRTSGKFDGVIDFDSATRDPTHPTRC